MAPVTMCRRRARLSLVAACSCARPGPAGSDERGSIEPDGSDPPGRGPGAGAGPSVCSHAGPAPWGSLRSNYPSREGHRAPLRVRRTTSRPGVRFLSLAD